MLTVISKRLSLFALSILFLLPSQTKASDEHYELHFAVSFVGTYGLTKILESKGFSKWESRLTAAGIMALAGLYKEYVYDPEPDGGDLLFDGLGISCSLIILEF